MTPHDSTPPSAHHHPDSAPAPDPTSGTSAGGRPNRRRPRRWLTDGPPLRWLVLASILLAITAGTTLGHRLLEDQRLSEDPLRLELRADLQSMAGIGIATAAADGPGGAALALPSGDLETRLGELYSRRDYRPLWWSNGTLQPRAEQVLDLMAYCPEIALEDSPIPEERLRATLHWAGRAEVPHRTQVRWELALTATLLRCVDGMASTDHDLPSTLGWQVRNDWKQPSATSAFDEMDRDRDAGDLEEAFSRLAPPHPQVRALGRAALAYREIVRSGGWPTVPGGPTLEPGQSADAERLERLAERLRAEGFLESASVPAAEEARSSALYDGPLVEAVRRFQDARGLLTDGKVGPQTLEVLNVPARDRLEQIVLNLVRARWLPAPPEGPHILVNLPAYRLHAAGHGGRGTARVIIGKKSWPTPIFDDRIEYLVANPAWHVPSSIARSEVVPKLLRNPGSAASEGFVLYESWEREATVDPKKLRKRVRKGNLPHIVQQPGPWNPLGQLKLVFPNENNVYLHDTNARSLFAKSDRALSHGCIRVEDPLSVVDVLFGGSQGEKVREAVTRGHRRTIRVQEPVPVALVYLTAWVRDDGTLELFRDPYERDPKLAGLLRALGERQLPTETRT